MALEIFHVGLLLVFKTDRNEVCNGFTYSSVSVFIVNTRCRISAPLFVSILVSSSSVQ